MEQAYLDLRDAMGLSPVDEDGAAAPAGGGSK
jgi:hypothetical protein